MRIRLIGLGRIGAFHAQPAAIAAVAEKVGAEPADSPVALLKALAVTWMAEAATLSVKEHRPVLIDDVRL